MDTTYKCHVSGNHHRENVTISSSTVEDFLSQKVVSKLTVPSSGQNSNTTDECSYTHTKLLDSLMTAPTLMWTGTMPKNISDCHVRTNMPTSYIQIHDLHAMAQANLIAQTQEIISKQLQSEAEQNDTRIKAQSVKIHPHEIKNCNKVQASHKKIHNISQSSSRCLWCPYKDCNRTFTWPAHLKYHQLTHTGLKKYTCNHDGCGKSFYTKQRLVVHGRTHSGIRPFVCTDPNCDKSFTTAQNLANHHRIHTGERPYACDYDGCTRRFAEISSLRKHSRTHTGKKPFSCDICGKLFTQSGSRTVHWKRHHMNKSSSDNSQTVNEQEATAESGILVLQTGVEDVSHYEDIHGSESVVFTEGVSDQVQTVSTQSSQTSCNLTTQVLSSVALHSSDLAIKHKGVNFVVLSQPQKIISISSTVPQKNETGEKEIFFKNEMLGSDLSHEEIAHSEFILQSLTNAQEDKEILSDSHLVPQEVSEVIVGDCINSEEETEISVGNGLISEEVGEISVEDNREIQVEDTLMTEEVEISITDNMTTHSESVIGIENRESEASRDNIDTQQECHISVGDNIMSHRLRQINIEVGLMSNSEIRDCIHSQNEREITVGKTLSDHNNLGNSSQPGKEMIMDPMMESDDEGDISTSSEMQRKK